MTITLAKNILARELDGEMVLLDLGSERFFGLDTVSTRVWQLLRSGADRARIITVLLREYQVERDELERDVNELLHQLADARLIEIG